MTTESTALVSVADRLAQMAGVFKEKEKGTALLPSISAKSGMLSVNETPFAENSIICVILNTAFVNAWYEEAYDSDVRSAPDCYALSEFEDGLAPHPDAINPVAENCESCPKNQWGSADKGNGKACSNRRRLAIMEVGRVERDRSVTTVPDNELKNGSLMSLSLPATSIKPFAAYVKALAAQKLPPCAVVTKISTAPGKKAFVYTFAEVKRIPLDFLGEIMDLSGTVLEELLRPYEQVATEEQPATDPANKPKTKF